MAEISVDTGGMKTQENYLQTVIGRLEKAETELGNINGKITQYLSSQAYQNIRRKISQESGRMEQNKKAVQSLKEVLQSSRDLYQNTENNVESYFGKSSRVNWSQTGGNISASFTGFRSINDILKIIKNPSDDIKEKIKTILDVMDKWGEKKEAGILKDIGSYIEDLVNFYTGDKKGMTGASDLCKLADSSISVWKGLYDYCRDTYKGITTGFFGDAAKRNVQIVGVAGGVLGLLGSVFSASSGFEEKKWQSIVADYVDCGKDLITVIKSEYKLKNIKEVKSGFWSAVDIYSAIGNATIETISQGFRSHEKYYSDGKWDLKDTDATGIDISIAGIYGLSHKLTLGLDDFIFDYIDKISGGDGTDNMSFVEKAAEGYKILGTNLGNFIFGCINKAGGRSGR